MHKRLAIPITLTAMTLTSCTVGPNYSRPEQDLPRDFKSASTQPTSQPTSSVSRQWWELFNDPILSDLEQTAIASNSDLKAAMARVEQARAAARIAGSSLYPTITFNPSITRSRQPNFRNNGANGTVGGVRTSNDVQIPFDLNYEVDVWGRIRRSIEAANAQAKASENDYEVILQTLLADVAVDYFGIRSLVSQEQILAQTAESFRQQVQLTQTQLRAGLVGQTDTYQADAQLQATISQQIDTRRQREDLEHALAILLNKSPSVLILAAEPLNLSPPEIPAGLPADLLRQRPDVAEAEQNLVAANAQIGVAQALFYPTISLTGMAGFESVDVRHSLDWEQRAWSIGASAVQPIFEGGKLTANLEQAKARYNELQATYRTTVLGAIRDVEDSLTDVHERTDQAAAQDRAVQASREYVRLSQLQYRQGLIGYLQVIDAERTLLNNQLLAAQVLNQRLASNVLLIKALGGGWSSSRQ